MHTDLNTTQSVVGDEGVLLDPSIIAGLYKDFTDRCLDTQGGASWAFGNNGSTVTFVAVDDIGLIQRWTRPKHISEKNIRALKLLENWFSEPDDLGSDFWQQFEKDLKTHRFRIS